MPELIKILDLKATIITTTSLNYQYKTSNAIVNKKDNKDDLYEDVKNYLVIKW